MDNDDGHPANADGPSPAVEPVPVSPVPASVPDAELIRDVRNIRRMMIDIRHHLMTGLIHRQSGRDPKPSGFCFAEVPDWQLRQWAYFLEAAAKAMETGTAKTEGLGAKHDSAVAKP